MARLRWPLRAGETDRIVWETRRSKDLMSTRRLLAHSSLDLLTRQLTERRRSASEIAETLRAEVLDARATADNSDHLDPASLIGTVSEESFALAARADETVREIDRALGRIADGTYGRCQECARMIPFRRLKALPATTVCVDCKTHTHPRRAARAVTTEQVLT